MRFRLIGVLTLALACTALAQQHPNQQKGFEPGKVYQFDGLDNVNMFNGNLVLTIPIGQRYTVSSALSYGLTLVYNGNPWLGTEQGTVVTMVPTPRSNAGMGWMLTMGRLIGLTDKSNQTYDPLNLQNARYIYESPDGADHIACCPLAINAPVIASDDSNIRFTQLSSDTIRVDLPDGTRQIYQDRPVPIQQSKVDWRLTRILDWFNNSINIGYDQSGDVWTITDSAVPGRQQILKFRTLVPGPQGQGNNFEQTVLDYIELAAFGTTTARYDFSYTLLTVARGSGDNSALHGLPGPDYNVQFLTQITLPANEHGDRASFIFKKPVTDDDAGAPYYGTGHDGYITSMLRGMQLPTKGWVEWDWAGVYMPSGSAEITLKSAVYENPDPLVLSHQIAVGVQTRRKLDEHRAPLGTWHYDRVFSSTEKCTVSYISPVTGQPTSKDTFLQAAMGVYMTEPGDVPADADCQYGCPVTASYFSTYGEGKRNCATGQNPSDFDRSEYGLPINRYFASGGRFLSVQNGFRFGMTPFTAAMVRGTTLVNHQPAAALPGLLRSRYAAFDDANLYNGHHETASRTFDYLTPPADASHLADPGLQYKETFNREIERIPGSFSAQLYREPKLVISGGNIGGQTRYKASFTAWEPIGANNVTDPNSPWDLMRYTDKCAAEFNAFPGTGGQPALPGSCTDLINGTGSIAPVSSTMEKACFDVTGFLKGRRVLKAPPDPQAGDIVALFKEGQGNPIEEAWYGGDGNTPPDVCTDFDSAPASKYHYKYAYTSGSLTSAQALVDTNNWLYTLIQSIDAPTGLVSSVTESSDASPGGIPGVTTSYSYNALGQLTSETPHDPGTDPSAPFGAYTTYRYNVATDDGHASADVTKYASRSNTELTKSSFEYDALGRLILQSQTMPDESTSQQRTTYLPRGLKYQVSELEKTPQNFTTFSYDALGRVTGSIAPDGIASTTVYHGAESLERTSLVATTRFASPATFTRSTTAEHYDVFGRLIRVTDGVGTTASYTYDVSDHLLDVSMGQNPRTFTYDPLGFLRTEVHPETNLITYSGFDAKGHATQKSVNGGHTLTFNFDGAERLLTVSDEGGALKEYTYDSVTGPDSVLYKRPGRLLKTLRHNRIQRGDRKVSQFLKYEGPRLALSSKTTVVTGAGSPDVTFSEAIRHDDLGVVDKVSYPTLDNIANVTSARTVTNKYARGSLTEVVGFTAAGARIGYAENGMLTFVPHSNGINDRITVDSNHMRRPAAITFGNCAPAIVQQPGSASAEEGNPVALTVIANGDGLEYQWYRGTPGSGTLIQGATVSWLGLTVTAATAGSYYVHITDACGAIDSMPANVQIACVPITVVRSSDGVTVKDGGSVTLFVNVNGIVPTYKWRKWVNSTNHSCAPGSSGCTLAVLPQTPPDDTNTYPVASVTEDQWYQVEITPGNGDTCSSVLRTDIHVNHTPDCSPLVITTQPQSVASFVANSEKDASLGVVYSGSACAVTWEQMGPPYTTFVPVSNGNVPTISVSPKITTIYRAHIVCTGTCPAADKYTDEATVHVTACSEVTINVQPPDQRVIEGQPAVLSVGVTGTHLQYFTWYAGQSGDTSHFVGSSATPTFTTPPMTEDAAFWVRVTSDNCSIDSSTFHVTVCHPPRVTISPRPQTLTPGEVRQFNVIATGSGLHYQWFKGPAHDVTASVPFGYDAAVVDVSITETTTIWVRLTGECGTADSDGATALYCVPPSFVTVPPDQVVVYGQQPAFTVAVNQPNVHYQWFVMPADSSSWQQFGGDAPTAQLPVISAGYAAMRVMVSNANCSAYSRTVSLDICVPPSVSVVSGDQYTDAGAGAILSAGWDQLEMASAEWYQGQVGDRSHFVGCGNTEVHPDTTTTYWLEVTNGRCASVGAPATVYVCRPRFSTQPQSKTFVAGVDPNVHLTVEAVGTPPITYQWYAGASGNRSQLIQGATGTDLTVSPTATTSYWVEANCACPIETTGAASSTATITYCVPPSAPAPAPLVVRNGDAATLSVSATGTNLHYHWYQGAPNDPNAIALTGDSPQITIPAYNTVPHYWVHITGDCGTADVAVDVTICYPPAITQAPASVTIPDGSTATLTVTTSATGVTYQWYQGTWPDASHPVGTNATSYTTPALVNTTGYWVRVSGAQCAADSGTATVTVCTRPAITAQPLGASEVTSGSLVHLTVAASPGNPGDTMRYDWYSGAAGDTSQAVYLNGPASIDVTPAVTTSYWVRVTNSSCYRDSVRALVDVCIPRITQQPPDASIVQGNPATLSVVATGTTPLTYQWYLGSARDTSSPIQGGTGTSVSISPNSTANYWVLVKSPCNTTNPGLASRTVTVTVCVPAHVTTPPSSVNINLGQSATFTVTATGTNPRYAWYTGPVGTTTTQLGSAATLTFTPSDTTSVWARVTADCGASSDSTLATVDVCSPPVITTQPADTTIRSGTSATFSVAASGTSLTYQWYQGENTDTSHSITGATSASYTTPALTADTRYWVNVTSKNRCSTRSASALAQMCAPPSASITPSVANISSGQSVILQVPPGAASYQWYTGASGNTASPITNANTYYIDAHPTTNTNYWVRVSNGICWSDSISVPVNVCVPAITTQPASTAIVQWSSATLSVTATSATSYQWYVAGSGAAVSGATNATMTISPSTTTSYWVRVTGSCGMIDSQSATVTVTPCTRPAIQTQPQSTTIPRGTSTTLSVVATGTNLTYQWYKSDPSGSAFVAAGTTSSITVAPTSSLSNYYVVVSNACGSIQSSTASVTTTTCTNPSITQQPGNYTIQSGGSATFSVGATGTNLHYQWYKSDPVGSTYVAVTGGIAATLTITPNSSQANYYVKVWGDCGSVLTSVTVTASFSCNAVYITSQPQSTTINSGDMTILSVSANGASFSDPAHYAWYESSDGIHFYNFSSAPSVSVQPSVTSYYYCVVSNNCHTATSDVVSVTVVGGGGVMAGQPQSRTVPAPWGSPKLHSRSNGSASGTLAPVIMAQPQSATVPPGGTATLSIAADSGTFQWYASTDGETYQPIASATDPILTVSPAGVSYYFARVTNEWAALNSEVATVTVAVAPLATPSYAAVTQEVSFAPGWPVSMEVRANGTDLHYQWFKSDPTGVVFTALGADSPRLTDTPAGPEAVYVVQISNEADMTQTQLIVARSTACAAPVITTQPQGAAIHTGGSATLQIAATGSGLSYQWFASDATNTGWLAMPDATGSSLTVTPEETRFYYCVITSECGAAVTSNSAAVEVTP